jgi:hypothetical protein
MSLSVLGLVAYVALTRRRRLRPFVATGLVWAALFGVYSLTTFGSPIPPYFLTSHLQSGVLGVETLQRSYLQALAGTLFSPGRGLFVYVPFLALVLVLAVVYRRQLVDKKLAWIAVGVSLAHWQLLSANRIWWGGQSFGPRLFSDVLVWLFLLAVMVTLAWRRGRSGRLGPRGWAGLAGVALLVAASIAINYRGATARETYRWKEEAMWDWRRPQFLAGLALRPTPRSLGERIAELRSDRDPGERDRVLEAILSDPAVERRVVGGSGMIAVGVTWDRWTRGESPAALVVENSGSEPATPTLGLAVWAGSDRYPITVFVEDGDGTHRHTFERRGKRRIELAPVAGGSRRLYLIWSDKSWSPGARDPRTLGVQLLPG